MQTDRNKQMTRAYTEANKRLRTKHIAEFHQILEQVYDEWGMEVNKRARGEMKRLREIAKARALLESYGEL